jgi:site-specific recombinase XerD
LSDSGHSVARSVTEPPAGRDSGPILRNVNDARMDRHAATRRLKHRANSTGIRMRRMHPHMLRHTFVTTIFDAGVSHRDVQIAARHADPSMNIGASTDLLHRTQHAQADEIHSHLLASSKAGP